MPEQLPPEKPESYNGFFSTDTGSRKGETWADSQALLNRSIQRTPNDDQVSVKISDRGEISVTQAIASDSNAWGDGLKGIFNGGFGNMSQVQAAWYASQGFIGYQMCAIIAQNWLVGLACSRQGEDAVRNWFTVTFADSVPEDTAVRLITAFEEYDKKFSLRQNLEQFTKMNRVFGVRHALFLVSSTDQQYYEKPFNPDGVTPGSYKGISQIDPYWITPELDADATANPTSKHFYEPTYYRISGRRYHRSHFVIIQGEQVADILKPTYFYGGVPLTQQIYERVYAAERTANEAPLLLMTKRLNVIHTDVEKAMANPGLFEKRMNEWLYYRDNHGLKVAGKDEVIEQFDTTLTDFDETVMTQFQLVAAIALSLIHI